jgi:hypothetical protein
LRRGNSGQVEKVREWVMRMRVLEVGGEGEREMVFDTAIREDEERERDEEGGGGDACGEWSGERGSAGRTL